jgi:hypothetical protein
MPFVLFIFVLANMILDILLLFTVCTLFVSRVPDLADEPDSLMFLVTVLPEGSACQGMSIYQSIHMFY